MLLTRRNFLSLGSGLLLNFKTHIEIILNKFNNEKAALVYKIVTQQKNSEKDAVLPKVRVTNKPEEYIVNLERVLDNKESRYTIITTMKFKGDDRKTTSHRMDIYRRTHGPEYNNSLIFVRDDNVDGRVDKGETKMTQKPITLLDPGWNQICKEKMFNPQNEKITYGNVFARVYDKALDDILTHLEVYKIV